MEHMNLDGDVLKSEIKTCTEIKEMIEKSDTELSKIKQEISGLRTNQELTFDEENVLINSYQKLINALTSLELDYQQLEGYINEKLKIGDGGRCLTPCELEECDRVSALEQVDIIFSKIELKETIFDSNIKMHDIQFKHLEKINNVNSRNAEEALNIKIENTEKIISEGLKKLDEDIKTNQIKIIEILSIFVAVFAFIIVNFSTAAKFLEDLKSTIELLNGDWYFLIFSIALFEGVFMGSLYLFFLLLHNIVHNNKKSKGKYKEAKNENK